MSKIVLWSCPEVFGGSLLVKTRLQHGLDEVGHLSSYKTGPLPHGHSMSSGREQKQVLNVLQIIVPVYEASVVSEYLAERGD